MTTYRGIESVYRGDQFHMVGDGFRVASYIPTGVQGANRMSPFILFDYHAPFLYPSTDQPRGVGVHPHKGFETVTVAWEGKVAHHDSAGHSGVVGPGDVQWMTAGSGILHKEYHEREWAKAGGTLHMAQIWVNLPRAHKNEPPKYQDLPAEQMGRVTLPEGSGYARVIAGEYQGVKGPAFTYTPLHMVELHLNEGGKAAVSYPATYNTALLVARGSVRINGEGVAPEHTLIVFNNEAGDVAVEAVDPDSMVLVLSGEPINEPIYQHGPFVMNTREEAMQAFRDFYAGKFGRLEN